MDAIQLVANGTETETGKNKNVFSKKIFLSNEAADKYKDAFYEICTHPIKGYTTHLNPDEDVEIKSINLELVEET